MTLPERGTSGEMPKLLLRAFPPSRDDLLLSTSRRVTDDMLVEISEADYGMNAEANLAQLRLIRDHNQVSVPMGWEPKEVLQLLRWSEPADPKRKPGSAGERGHIMRAFACAALLRAAAEPANHGYFEGESATLAQLIDSVLFLGGGLPEAVARFLTWRIPQLDYDEEQPFFEFGLFCLAILVGGEPVDSSNAAELVDWLEAEESDEQRATGASLTRENHDRLLGLIGFGQKHETWRSIARRVHEYATSLQDMGAARRIQSAVARVAADDQHVIGEGDLVEADVGRLGRQDAAPRPTCEAGVSDGNPQWPGNPPPQRDPGRRQRAKRGGDVEGMIMAGRTSRRWLLVIALATLYLLTWVGGWRSHTDELRNRAQRLWDNANRSNQATVQSTVSPGFANHPVELRPGGPATSVDWCFPLLPGVLVVDSSYVIGPLWGKGGVKIVLYYGFGNAELMTLWGWIS